MSNRVSILIDAKDLASAEFHKVDKAASATGLAIKAASLVAIAGLTALGVSSIKAASDFNESLS